MIWLLACAPAAYDLPGPHAVGHAALGDGTVWYPATEAGSEPVETFLTDDQAALYAPLLADAPCASTQTGSRRDAPRARGTFPLVVFSHCHECTRFSTFTVAERLASHGFVVAAADHTGNTLWDQLDETGLPLDEETLALRVQQHTALLEAALEDPSVDPSTVGAYGHSFGAVTTGMLAQEQDIQAALALAAPMENPLLPGVEIARLDIPLGFLVAVEDNSITELGNELMRSNFDEAGTGWKLELEDAGHWSVSDIAGVTEAFEAGCGDGERQTNGEPFTYLDARQARDITASFVTAFFAETLLQDEGALDRLGLEIEAR